MTNDLHHYPLKASNEALSTVRLVGLSYARGPAAATVFGITLLAPRPTFSTTTIIAGQAIMEGLLGRKMNLWARRIIARMINTIPTTITILLGIEPILILVHSQVALSLLLPLPLLPLLIFTRDKKSMRIFVTDELP